MSQELVDRLGRPYTPMMLPALRFGLAPANKGQTYEAQSYSRDEVRQVMRALGRGRAGVRDRAIATVMYRAGGRISETLAMRVRDVRRDAGEIYFRFGKGNRHQLYKPRTTPIDDEAMAVIEKWMRLRAQLLEAAGVDPGRAPLFCTITKGNVGAPVQASVFREKLHRVERRIEFPKRLHPHGLRYSAACDLLAEGYDPRQIQVFLGHESLDTTMKYLPIDYNKLRAQVRGRRWAGDDPPAAGEVSLDAVLKRLALLEQLLQDAA